MDISGACAFLRWQKAVAVVHVEMFPIGTLAEIRASNRCYACNSMRRASAENENRRL